MRNKAAQEAGSFADSRGWWGRGGRREDRPRGVYAEERKARPAARAALVDIPIDGII